MSVWIDIAHAPKNDVIDLWGAEKVGAGLRRWPDCWWGPSGLALEGKLPEGWFCRLGGAPFQIWPTHYMSIPEGPR